MGIQAMRVLLAGLVIALAAQAKISGRVKNDPNFQMNDLVDWSSFPGRSDLNPDDEDSAKESFDGWGADPIEAAGLFEGDIENVLFDDLKASHGRNAIRESWRKWPGASIPYVISSTFNTNERRVIAKAMKEYHEK